MSGTVPKSSESFQGKEAGLCEKWKMAGFPKKAEMFLVTS
jgi:hypothetical protein